MEAIETEYSGYRFRSRLEARWAVAFDCMGLLWEYEPEGFELGDGVRYLPDFRLPQLRTWIEVKPPIPVTEYDAKKINMFKAAVTTNNDGWFMLTLWGSPGEHEIRQEPNTTGREEFISCPKCRMLFIGRPRGTFVESPREEVLYDENCPSCGLVVGLASQFHRMRVRVDAAFSAAKQMRFETHTRQAKAIRPPSVIDDSTPTPKALELLYHERHLGVLCEVVTRDTYWELTFEVLSGRLIGCKVTAKLIKSGASMKDKAKTKAQVLMYATRLGLLRKVVSDGKPARLEEVEGKNCFTDVLGAHCFLNIVSDEYGEFSLSYEGILALDDTRVAHLLEPTESEPELFNPIDKTAEHRRDNFEDLV